MRSNGDGPHQCAVGVEYMQLCGLLRCQMIWDGYQATARVRICAAVSQSNNVGICLNIIINAELFHVLC